jgi:uridine kinase
MSERLSNKPYLIGISGGSASGKTFFLDQLLQKIGAANVCLISQDEYYKPKAHQVVDEKGVINFDLPEAIDHRALYTDLQRILNGESIQKKEYTFNNPNRIPKTFHYFPANVILVEGIFVFHYEQIRSLLDLTVFLQSSKNIKFQRRIQRDIVERGYDADHVHYTQEHHVDVAYREFIKPYRRMADLVINNNEKGFDTGMEVLVNHIQSKLLQK